MDNKAQGKPLPLSGSLRTPTAFLAGTAVAVPALLVIIAAFVMRPDLRATLIPGLVVLSAITFGWAFWLLRRVGVQLDGDRLVVHASIVNRTIALAELKSKPLQIVDLDTNDQLRPMLRTWGMGLPGLTAGWCRLRNGDKALCVLTGRKGVSYLRSAQGFVLLLSLQDPQPLRTALER